MILGTEVYTATVCQALECTVGNVCDVLPAVEAQLETHRESLIHSFIQQKARGLRQDLHWGLNESGSSSLGTQGPVGKSLHRAM